MFYFFIELFINYHLGGDNVQLIQQISRMNVNLLKPKLPAFISDTHALFCLLMIKVDRNGNYLSRTFNFDIFQQNHLCFNLIKLLLYNNVNLSQ